MTMVASYEISWEETSSRPRGQRRRAWREAVAAIAEKAKAKLPECNGRVDKAVALVLSRRCRAVAGWHGQGGQPEQRHYGRTWCQWPLPLQDYEQAPHNFCKHRLSAAIARRAQELTKAKLDGHHGQEPPSQPDTSAARRSHGAPARGTGEHHAQSHPARP